MQDVPDWLSYRAPDGFHDGCLDASGPTREHYRRFLRHLERLGREGVTRLQKDAEISLLNQGITFTVYSDSSGTERIFPFDLVPRLVSAREWAAVGEGISQRLRAINLFLDDIYGEQRILRDGIVPTGLVVNSTFFCREMHVVLGVLRRAGVPARYASGYLYDPATDPAQSSLRGAAASHAWVQAWHSELGWVGIDPTNDKLVDWQYVRIALGRDYGDVRPVRGVFRGSGEQTLSISVEVTLLDRSR